MTSTPTTYGEHAELAAGALTRLMSGSALPVAPDDVDQLLFYRDALVDSLRQRLHDLALLPVVDRAMRAPASWATDQQELLPTAVAAIASELPRRAPSEEERPLDLFARRSTDPTVHLWRTAAVESMSASHVLSTASQRGWHKDDSARWHVLRDVSTTLESLLLLDDTLTEVGLLNEHDAPSPSMDAGTRRAVLSQTTRMAGWLAPDSNLDRAIAAPDTPADPPVASPVLLVTQSADVPRAQQALTTALRPRIASDTGFAGEPHLTAGTARHLVSGQLLLINLTRRLAPATSPVHEALAARSATLGRVDALIQRLVDHDVERVEASQLPFLQQAEISTSLHRLVRDGRLPPLTRAEAEDWAEASRGATHAVAVALRRELLRDDSNLRIDDLTGAVGPTRVLRHSALERALTITVTSTTASLPRVPTVAVQRAVLRSALDETPTRQTELGAPARHTIAPAR